MRDHSGGSQLPPEHVADRNRAASCLESMPRTETRAAGCLESMPRNELEQLAASNRRRERTRAAGCPVRASGPRCRSRLPSARRRRARPNSRMPPWRSFIAFSLAQDSCPPTVAMSGVSARRWLRAERRSRARATRCDRAAFTLRQALTRPNNRRRCRRDRSAHAPARR